MADVLDPEVQKIMAYSARKPGFRLGKRLDDQPDGAAEMAQAVPAAQPLAAAVNGSLVPAAAEPAAPGAAWHMHMDPAQSSFTLPGGATFQGQLPSYRDRLEAGGQADQLKAMLMRSGFTEQQMGDPGLVAPHLAQLTGLRALQKTDEDQGIAEGRLALDARSQLGHLGVAQATQAQAAEESRFKMDVERQIEEAQKQALAAALAKNGGRPLDPALMEATNRSIRQVYAPQLARQQSQGGVAAGGGAGQPGPGMPQTMLPAGSSANAWLDQQQKSGAAIPLAGDVINVGGGRVAADAQAAAHPGGAGATGPLLGDLDYDITQGELGKDPVAALQKVHRLRGTPWLTQNWDPVMSQLEARVPNARELITNSANANGFSGPLGAVPLIAHQALRGIGNLGAWLAGRSPPQSGPGAMETFKQLDAAPLGEKMRRMRGKHTTEDDLNHLVRLKMAPQG